METTQEKNFLLIIIMDINVLSLKFNVIENCECFNSGNYCIDCNCKNFNNKPPINSYTNKQPTEDSKNKKEIICTCTKNGCNENYCECFKNDQKFSSLCRCISCKNND